MIKLRDYQKECVDAIDSLEGGSHLVQMATGLGKTVTFSRIARNGRVLIISHRDELVRQPARYYDCSFGIEKAGERSCGEEVVSASVQTLKSKRRLAEFDPEEFDTIITDEAHHAAAPSYKKIFEYFKPRLHIGFTATPKRGDGVRLDDVYEDIIFERDLLWGINNGYLCDIDARRVELTIDTKKLKMRAGDFTPGELADAMNNQVNNRIVCDSIKEHGQGPVLVFAVNVEHAETLAGMIPEAEVLTGTTPPEIRRDIIRRFKAGEMKCLVNCMVLTEGADLPNVGTVVIARPTRSTALYTQMVGRGTRLSEGKDKLVLLDCVGVTADHSLCTAPTLLGLDPEEHPEDTSPGEGLLTGMGEAFRAANDCPRGWLMSVRKVDVFADTAETGNSYYGVAWAQMYDGTRIVSVDRGIYAITAPDTLGKCTLTWIPTEGEPEVILKDAVEDSCFRCARDVLIQKNIREKHLWATQYVRKWGAEPATQKQRVYLKHTVGPELYQQVAGEKLNKREIGMLIDNAKRVARNVV